MFHLTASNYSPHISATLARRLSQPHPGGTTHVGDAQTTEEEEH